MGRLTVDLAGRGAIVTGGSRGIGRAIVLALVRAGARVLFTYRTSTADAEALRGLIAQEGGEVTPLQCDAAAPEAAFDVIRAAEGAVGRIDILVNNAGITRDKPLYLMEDDEWSDVLNTNLAGVFRLTRAAVQQLCRSEAGRVINIASVAGLTGVPGQANYCAAKAGIIGFTRAVSREVARFGVTANVIAPGYIDSDMLAGFSPERRKEVQRRVPAGRLGAPGEVAAAALFLSSDEAGYINGQVLVLDGGLT